MTRTALVFDTASLKVLQAVIVACSQQRDLISTGVDDGREHWAPKVHCSGSVGGDMVYAIHTAPMGQSAALAVMMAASAAERSVEVTPFTG